MLEDHADLRSELHEIGAAVRHLKPLDPDGAAADAFQTVDALDQHRLAGPGRTAHDHHLAMINGRHAPL